MHYYTSTQQPCQAPLPNNLRRLPPSEQSTGFWATFFPHLSPSQTLQQILTSVFSLFSVHWSWRWNLPSSVDCTMPLRLPTPFSSAFCSASLQLFQLACLCNKRLRRRSPSSVLLVRLDGGLDEWLDEWLDGGSAGLTMAPLGAPMPICSQRPVCLCSGFLLQSWGKEEAP